MGAVQARVARKRPIKCLICLFSTQVCPSNNPLDKKDFNPIDYINELFPNEQVGTVCI